MKDITALLVHNDDRPFDELQRRLKELSITSLRLRTFVEAKYFLKRLHHPALIFTDVTLPDGTWADVVEAGKNATPPCPVIVVSRFVDLSLYLEASQKGAADFIVPPFATKDFELIIHSAVRKLADTRGLPSVPRAGGAVGTDGIVLAESYAGAGTKASHAEKQLRCVFKTSLFSGAFRVT